MKHVFNVLSLFVLIACVHAKTYCPAPNDFVVAYGTPQIFSKGWTNNGGGGVATKAAYNLLGGSVEYDVDLSRVRTGINANVYTVSPTFSGTYNHGSNYCDAQKSGNEWCVEVDWLESNGNCGGQTTLHTRPGPGNDGCTAWGCHNTYRYNGKTSFHMKITYDSEGRWTTIRDGQTITGGNMQPAPQNIDWAELKRQYQTRGAVIVSTQWAGWVPLTECGTSGDLGASSFTVRNLKITGTVVQGPEPTLCASQPPPSPNPPPTPNPPTPPPPTGNCDGISLASDPNNRYWVEVNAPQSAHVYAICTNGDNEDKYLSCAYNWGKWVCNPNGQECYPDYQSPRYAVVNNNRCRLNINVPRATADNEVEDASNFVDEFATDAAIADTVTEFTDANVVDAAVADTFDSGVFDAAVAETDAVEIADSGNSDEFVDNGIADASAFDSELALAVADESTQSTTSTENNIAPNLVVVVLVLISLTAIGLFVAVIYVGLSFRKY